MSKPEDLKDESAEVADAEDVVPVSETDPQECNQAVEEESSKEDQADDRQDDTDTEDGEGETETVVTIESLQEELEIAATEVSKFRDTALRAEAEMQNVRRRASKDLENAHKYGLDKLVQNILPVIDSLEKAVEAAEHSVDEDTNKAIVDGVGLCHKMLVDVLSKENVEVVDPMGEPFDPNLHQAMSMVENVEVEPNTVVVVVQKGYTLNKRLVRPAMVMVSKGVSPQIDEKA
jgi:molecular chaperone GrpE